MGIPLRQISGVGADVARQHLAGRKRYPLVLMLEPLFQCNLACAGCGKIDYPDPILAKRLCRSKDALEVGRRMRRAFVVICRGRAAPAQGAARDRPRNRRAQEIRHRLHQRAAASEEDRPIQPGPYFTWSIHLDGDRESHDRSVCQAGVYERAVAAFKTGEGEGVPRHDQLHLLQRRRSGARRRVLRQGDRLGVDGLRCRRVMPTSAPPIRRIS